MVSQSTIDLSAVSPDLTGRVQWVAWKWEQRRVKMTQKYEWTKVPMDARKGRRASTTDNLTWSPLDVAIGAFNNHDDFAGIGFVFSSGDPLTGIDLDKCRNAETGEVEQWALEWIKRFPGAYIEESPTGTGIHIITVGKSPHNGKTTVDGQTVEIYSIERFFTVSGRVIQEADKIQDGQAAIKEFVARYWPKEKKKSRSKTNQNGSTKLTDQDLLKILFDEKKEGQKWQDLWSGEYEDHYPSPSEAVAALLWKFAFYTNRDADRMDRLIRASGLDYEKFDEPRGGSTWLEDEIEKALDNVTEGYRPSINGHGSPKKKPKKDEDETAPTHDELRDRWIEGNSDHAYGLEDWRRYKDGIWPVVKTPIVKKSMTSVLENAKPEGIKPSVFVLNSVHALSQFEVYVPDDQWDANPDILVAQNGAVDLIEGKLLPHSPEHYATTAVPYSYDPDAAAPNWTRFIGDLDKDVVRFLQEFAGYCLTTDTSFEKAMWLIGQPGGGKSTLLEGFLAMLGVRAGVLGLAEIEKSRFSLAKLDGKTLVTATEQPAGYVSCHHLLNAIISGEPIQVERKWKDPYDLIPRAKIAWAMNELPRIPAGAEGLFRRVEVVRFPEIDEEDRDPELKENIKGEGAGVLNWALEGLKRLRDRKGFDVPAKITDATAQFREYNDIPGLFVEERCIVGEKLQVKSSHLYSAYKDWCEKTGHSAKSFTTIVHDWERLGFTKKSTNQGNYWQGADLKEHDTWRTY